MSPSDILEHIRATTDEYENHPFFGMFLWHMLAVPWDGTESENDRLETIRRLVDVIHRSYIETERHEGFRTDKIFELGRALYGEKYLELAYPWLERAANSAQQLTEPTTRFLCYSTFVGLLDALGRRQDADNYLKLAIQEGETQELSEDRFDAYRDLYDLLFNRGQLQDADRYLEQAIRQAEGLEFSEDELDAFRHLHDILFRRGRLKEAESYLDRATRKARELDSPDELDHAYRHLSVMHFRWKRLQEALRSRGKTDSLDEALKIAESSAGHLRGAIEDYQKSGDFRMFVREVLAVRWKCQVPPKEWQELVPPVDRDAVSPTHQPDEERRSTDSLHGCSRRKPGKKRLRAGGR